MPASTIPTEDITIKLGLIAGMFDELHIGEIVDECMPSAECSAVSF